MKSFILSVIITTLICIFFVSLFDHKSRAFLNNISDKGFLVFVIIFFIGYLLSLYWGITGIFKGERALNFLGIGLSMLGLCLYALGYMVNAGNGKASPQQFDQDLSKIEVNQRAALNDLLQQTNTKETELQFTYYWGMFKNPNAFVVCIQKGNIIGLQVKNKPVNELKAVSKLSHLNWLVLEDCGLRSITDLDLPQLERLEISHNQLTSLSGIEHERRISWLDIKDNPVTDSSALQDHPIKGLYILK